jgi:hypothetical protein
MNVGRNDPCPCGSGRKYKLCCLGKEEPPGTEGDSHPGSLALRLTPETLSHARGQPVWEVDIAPLPFSFESEQDARPGALTVMAGEVVVFLDLLSRPPAESPEVAVELQRGMEEARKTLGRYPEEVLVRHRSVGLELMPYLSRHGMGLQVNPFLDNLDDMTAHLIAHQGGGSPVRSVASSPLTWSGWGLPKATVADVFKAAARFFKAEPWNHLLARHVTELRTPGGYTWFVGVSGGPMTPSGCLLFQEPGDAALSTTARTFEEILQESEGRHYSLLFRSPDHLPRPMRKEIAREGWPVAAPAALPILTSVNTPGGGISLQDAEDLSLSLGAITRFVEQTEVVDTGGGGLSWTDPATGAHLVVRELRDLMEDLEHELFGEDDDWDDDAWDDDEFDDLAWDDDEFDDLAWDDAYLGNDARGEELPPDGPWGDFPPGARTLFGPGSLFDSMLDEEARAELDALLPEMESLSLEEVNSRLGGIMDRANQRPVEVLGGLSPVQVQGLLQQDWGQGDGPLVLNRGLPLQELAPSRDLRNARTFLRALAEEEGAKLTSSGNLNRAFVRRMMDEGDWVWFGGMAPDEIRKVWNEGDFFPLHTLRILSDLGGLIRKFKGRFVMTRKGTMLLDDERAGELFALLFETQFKKMNLAYLDHHPAGPELQYGIPYTLFHLKEAAREWRTPEELVEAVLLPHVLEALTSGPGHWRKPEVVLENRVLDVLEGFGLLEMEELPGPVSWQPVRRYRSTPLYEEFVSFNW